MGRRDILDLLERLHRFKNAAYGDAWRKRGEVIAIFANMARKYDRLLVAFDEQRPAATEPLGDTIADLCVYSGKYLTWIAETYPGDFDAAELPLRADEASATRGPDALEHIFDQLAIQTDIAEPAADIWNRVQGSFTRLEGALMDQATPGAGDERLLTYMEKASLSWQLADELASLLVALQEAQPDVLDKLHGEVADMEQPA